MGKDEVGQFLTHLAVDGNVAASTQNQALAAVLLLYRDVLQQELGWIDDVVRAKKPKRLPEVYTVEEARMLIDSLRSVRWLIGMQLYGGGLRLQECLRLRVKDLNFDRLQVMVRDASTIGHVSSYLSAGPIQHSQILFQEHVRGIVCQCGCLQSQASLNAIVLAVRPGLRFLGSCKTENRVGPHTPMESTY